MVLQEVIISNGFLYPERGDEGILLRDAIGKGVVNAARYYHHETVCVEGQEVGRTANASNKGV